MQTLILDLRYCILYTLYDSTSLYCAVRQSCAEQHGHSEEFAGAVHICSENNFPTAAGLASSAAGYACLGVQFHLNNYCTHIYVVTTHWHTVLWSEQNCEIP